MGLIDVNKIPYLHLDLENKVRFDDVNIAFKDDIDNMPTVDAVPIEWMEKYAKRTSKKCCHCATAIWEMLDDWEKENESTRSDI